MTIRICALTLGFVLTTPLSGLAETTNSGGLSDFVVTTWTERDGIPSARIWSMTQDAQGYLWLGTETGLVRFDGVQFRSARSDIGLAMPESFPEALLSARDGSLWIGFADDVGITRIKNGITEHHDVRGGPVSFLFEDSKGTVWAGNRTGVHRFRDGAWRHFNVGPVSAAYEDRRGVLLIGAFDGLVRWSSERDGFEHLGPSPSIRGITEDSDGKIWITHPSTIFATVPAPGLNREPPLLSGAGNRILTDQHGNVWVGAARQGLIRIRAASGNRLTIDRFGDRDGITVLSLLEDRDGNIWAGTEAGLYRFAPRSVAAITNFVSRAVQPLPDGGVWVGTFDGLVRLMDVTGPPRWHKYTPRDVVTAMFVDKWKTIWAAVGTNVFRSSDDRFVPVQLPVGLRLSRIRSMASDSHGTLWLLDQKGLFVVRNGLVTTFESPSEVQGRLPNAVWADALDRVWIAFNGGSVLVLNADGSRRIVHPTTDGSTQTTRWTFWEDAGHGIWIGGPHGLSRFRDGRLETVTARNGLRGTVFAIVQDRTGDLWLAVGSSIVHLSVDEFERSVRNPSTQLRYEMYDASDGVAGKPIWFGLSGAARAADGKLWFVTTAGLSVVDPAIVAARHIEGKAQLDTVIANEQRVNPVSNATLDSGVSRLVIEYTVPNLSSSAKDTFRYRLEGFDNDWQDAGERRVAVYTNLPPGPYRFRVIGSSPGITDESSAMWEFSIEPFVYQTQWFRALCVIAVIGAISTAWWLRLRQFQNQAAVVMNERTRVSREIHDTLLQGLVGVALQLTAISNDSASSVHSTKQKVTALRHLVEEYIREARTCVWNLRSPRLTQTTLAAALRESGERITAGSSKQFEMTVSGVPVSAPQIDQELLRIAQEALVNAVRHSSAQHIHLSLRYENRSVILRVSDNGCGFDVINAIKSKEHFGLTSIRERTEQVGGQLDIEASPGQGTAVEVVIPLYKFPYSSTA